jgi:hypothetical protein
MAGSMTVQRLIVPQHERDSYLVRARERKAYYAERNCRFSVFAEADLPGAFMEFTEADDPQTLADAHADAPGPPLDAQRIYVRVEL